MLLALLLLVRLALFLKGRILPLQLGHSLGSLVLSPFLSLGLQLGFTSLLCEDLPVPSFVFLGPHLPTTYLFLLCEIPGLLLFFPL